MADNASDKFGEIPADERLVESAIFYWGSVLKRRKWKSQLLMVRSGDPAPVLLRFRSAKEEAKQKLTLKAGKIAVEAVASLHDKENVLTIAVGSKSMTVSFPSPEAAQAWKVALETCNDGGVPDQVDLDVSDSTLATLAAEGAMADETAADGVRRRPSSFLAMPNADGGSGSDDGDADSSADVAPHPAVANLGDGGDGHSNRSSMRSSKRSSYVADPNNPAGYINEEELTESMLRDLLKDTPDTPGSRRSMVATIGDESVGRGKDKKKDKKKDKRRSMLRM